MLLLVQHQGRSHICTSILASAHLKGPSHAPPNMLPQNLLRLIRVWCLQHWLLNGEGLNAVYYVGQVAYAWSIFNHTAFLMITFRCHPGYCKLKLEVYSAMWHIVVSYRRLNRILESSYSACVFTNVCIVGTILIKWLTVSLTSAFGVSLIYYCRE